ncbi:MAG TPA: peptidoglycan-binding domain-containing protein [Acetobacteraceae bacterium]|nr:peptidoglycan-binding domain-containing protein [Acetobacteraceae bacterium]
MTKIRSIAGLVAIGALTALAGCSSGSSENQMAAAPPAAAPAPAPTPPPATPGNELSKQTVRRIQTSLKRDGDYKGHVDGVWGPMTQNGVMQFQQKNGLQSTGNLDEQTLQAMHIGPTGAMGANSGETGGAMGGGTAGGSMGGTSTDMGTSTGTAGMSSGGTTGAPMGTGTPTKSP